MGMCENVYLMDLRWERIEIVLFIYLINIEIFFEGFLGILWGIKFSFYF